MAHVVGAFVGRVEGQRGGDEFVHLLEGARARGPEERLQLGEGLFDRIEVGAVGGQEAQRRPGRFDAIAHRVVLVNGQVVEDDHVAPLEEVTWVADTGVRYLRPEITLLYKAALHRPKDDRDLAVTWPLLDRDAREWLVSAVERLYPGHPWLGGTLAG